MGVFAGVLNIIKDFGKVLQVSYNGQTKDNIRNLMSYGFWSHPPKGSKVILIPDCNNNYYAIAYKDEVIPNLEEGESAVGNFEIGSIIKFDKEGNLNITCKKNKTINIDGDCTINVAGDTTVNSDKVIANATTSASVTAPVSTINSTTSCTISSGGIGNVVVTPAGTTIDGKNFLTHVHSGVTSGPSNTGGVV